jgi:hypothetical protein
MNIKTFDSIGPSYTPAPDHGNLRRSEMRATTARADMAGFAASPAPGTATRTETPFAASSALYERMHARKKRPVALLLAGAAVVVTGVIVLATAKHPHSTIGQQAPAAPAEDVTPAQAVAPVAAPAATVQAAPATAALAPVHVAPPAARTDPPAALPAPPQADRTPAPA